MSDSTRNIDIIYRAKVQEYQRGIDTMKRETQGLGQQTQQTTSQMDTAYQRTSDRVRDYFTVALGVMAGKKMIDAAAGLEQAVGGTAAVFAEAGGVIDDFAAGSAEAAGLSQRSARELTSQIGALLQGFGFARDESAEWSVTLSQLGADLAATFGGRPDEAVQALGAALRGEYDPLERFGVSLSAAKVNAEAVAMGLATSTNAVDSNAKAQAALALIMDQSTSAQGQFARESETASGQAAIAGAKMEDAAASMGEQLLPIYAKAAELAGTLADGFASLPGPIQSVVIAGAGLALFQGPLRGVADGISTVMSVAKGAPAVIDKMATGAYSLAGNLGTVAAVAGPAAVGVAGLVMLWQEGERQARVFDAAVNDLSGRIRELGEEDALTAVLDEIVTSSPQVASLFADVGVNLDELRGKLQEGGPAWEAYRQELVDGSSKSREMEVALDFLAGTYGAATTAASDMTDVVGETPGAMDDAEESTVDWDARLQELEATLTRNIDRASELNDTLRAQTDPLFALRRAVTEQAAAQQEYNELVATGTATADELTDAEWRVWEATTDLQTATLEFNGSMKDNPELVHNSMRALDQWVKSGAITEAQAAGIRDEVFELGGDVQRLSDTKWLMKMDADVSPAERKLADLQARLTAASSSVFTIAGFSIGASRPTPGPQANSSSGVDKGEPSNRVAGGGMAVVLADRVVGEVVTDSQHRAAIGGYSGR